jgi:hypothetical protein
LVAHGGRGLDESVEVNTQSPMNMSPLGFDAVRRVDHESRLTLSLWSRNEPNESSHISVRSMFRVRGGGFGKCGKGGGCEFGLCSGSGLRGLGKVETEACDGDRMLTSSWPLLQGFTNPEDGPVDSEAVKVRSCASARYSGLRIGHEMPACSSTSSTYQPKLPACCNSLTHPSERAGMTSRQCPW